MKTQIEHKQTRTANTRSSHLAAPQTPSHWDATPPIEPGEFPFDALPIGARNLVAEMSRVHGVPTELPGMAALATLGAACGTAFRLTGAANGLENHANLYLLAGAPAGNGKAAVSSIVRPLLAASGELKSDPFSVRAFRLKAEREMVDRRMQWLLNTLTHVDRRSTIYEAEKSELPRVQQRIAEIDAELASGTVPPAAHCFGEAVGALMSVTGQPLQVYSPDGQEVLRVFGGGPRGDDRDELDLLLAAYKSEPVKVRMNQSGRNLGLLTSPCLTLFPLVQPNVLLELFARPDALQRGLLARTLAFICDEPPREDDGTVAALDNGILSDWETRIRAVLAARGQHELKGTRVIHCSADAREIFRCYHNEIVKLRTGQFADLQQELTYSRENACRIALALCVGDDLDSTELSGTQAMRAVRIARWAQYSTLALLDVGRFADRSKRADRLRELLAANGGEANARRLERHNCIPPSESTALCRLYPESFACEHRDTGGRPSLVIRLVATTTPQS